MFGEIVALAKLSKPEQKKEDKKTDAELAAAKLLENADKKTDITVTGGEGDKLNEEKEQAKASLVEFLGENLAQYKSKKNKGDK